MQGSDIMENHADFECFINLFAELIEKYGDAVLTEAEDTYEKNTA